MKNKLHNINDDQMGFSFIELLIVIAIIAVVASLAFMKMGTANTQFQRQNVARELKVAFERARFDSVKRHAEGPNPAGTPMPATVVVDTNSYTLNTDSNRDGTYETLVTDFAAQNITIAGYAAMTLPITVSFDMRGEVTTTGVVNPQFLVCNVSCSAPTSSNANLLLVTLTGTVNLLGGGETPPTFGSANVSVVSNTSGISNVVRLP
jgi:prepilin-type N-terminal cleavage/methylation domain-containing protein